MRNQNFPSAQTGKKMRRPSRVRLPMQTVESKPKFYKLTQNLTTIFISHRFFTVNAAGLNADYLPGSYCPRP